MNRGRRISLRTLGLFGAIMVGPLWANSSNRSLLMGELGGSRRDAEWECGDKNLPCADLTR
jgi:hypothetical protein